MLQGDWNQPVQVDLAALQQSTKSVSCGDTSQNKQRTSFLPMARAVSSGYNLLCRKIQMATCALTAPPVSSGAPQAWPRQGQQPGNASAETWRQIEHRIIDPVKQHHERKQ